MIRKEFWALSPQAKEAIEKLRELGIEDPDLALEVLERIMPLDDIYEIDGPIESQNRPA